MKFDIFFSICQTEVDGYMPSEKVMFENFFDQLKLADELGYGVGWVAETHLSCEIQKQNREGIAVLHKPLKPAKLRALASHLLGI